MTAGIHKSVYNRGVKVRIIIHSKRNFLSSQITFNRKRLNVIYSQYLSRLSFFTCLEELRDQVY